MTPDPTWNNVQCAGGPHHGLHINLSFGNAHCSPIIDRWIPGFQQYIYKPFLLPLKDGSAKLILRPADCLCFGETPSKPFRPPVPRKWLRKLRRDRSRK